VTTPIRAISAAGIGLLALLVLAPPAHAEPRTWAPVPGKSEVAFTASFPLGNFTGRTQEVTGDFRADPADLRTGVTGFLRVAPGRLTTGDEGRDRDMRKALATERYPEIRFTIERLEPSFPSTTDRADVLLTVSGVMLIRGVERRMAFPARVRRRDDKLWVRGEAEIRMSDYGIRPPTRFFLEVKDAVLVSFDVTLAAAP
jgi:polyisoprenoid-binding protein YceI